MNPWFFTKAVVAIVVPLSEVRGVGAAGTPEKEGDARLDLRLSAVCWRVDTGLFTSEVLSTFASHTAVLSRVCHVLSHR